MHTLPAILLLPLLAGCLVLAVPGRGKQLLLALLAPVGVLVLAGGLAPGILDGAHALWEWEWLPAAGLDVSLHLDGLALLFVLLISGIGALVLLYARYYLSERDSLPRLYLLLLLFMTAMLGVVTSANLLVMVVFWELTSLSSFLLIAYWSDRSESRRGARLALAVTGGGGLALLGGVLLLGHMAGSYALADVVAAGDTIRAHPWYPVMLGLVLVGVFSKSAQVPLHFWLPHAMAAPTPVSAYLHSATMVKLGIFLLARLHPALAGTESWTLVVGGVGAATLLTGAWIALFQTDLKALLAYSTVSHLGLMTLLLGLGTPLALFAALFHLINHALFKAPLFMAAGILDHATGTRDLRRLGGLWRVMPITAGLSAVAAAAMAGVPLLGGYLSKRTFISQTLEESAAAAFGGLLPAVALVGGLLAVAYTLRFWLGSFAGRLDREAMPKPPHEAAWPMLMALAIPVAGCVGVGLWPDALLGPMLAAASGAALASALPELSLYELAHGPGVAISIASLALGAVLTLLWPRLSAALRQLPAPDARAVAEVFLRALLRGSGALRTRLESGSLQSYTAWLLLSAVVAGGFGMLQGDRLLGPVAMTPLDGATLAGMLVLMVTAIGTAALHRRRLLALLLMGASGLLVTLIFARFSAPDLALTQLSVEIMAVVILMLALSFLPQAAPRESTRLRRGRDLALAVVAGVGVSALALAVLTRGYEPISDYFLAQSKPLGGGTNVVNVILVDFRGFDTLGEITVLAIAALSVFVMTQSLQLKERVASGGGHFSGSLAHPLVLSMISRPVLPMALLVSAYIFLRGHNLPGGGFIAGLIAAVAMTLQYMANGLDWTHSRRRTFYRPVVAAGLLLALATGMGSLAFGHPFLSSWFTHAEVPLLGELELTTVIAFDAGVFLAVLGSTLLVLSNMGKLMTIHGPGKEVG